MGRENAQWAAVRAVEEYFESSPVVVRRLSSVDGMLWDDDELDLFYPEGSGYNGFFGKVPVEVKWSKNANVHPYKIERHYLLGLREDQGGFFFLVQRIKDVPHIYYAALTVEDINKQLEQKSYQVKIDLKEVPKDREVLEQELFDFIVVRRKEKVEILCERSVKNLAEDYEELKGKLDKINNEEDREKLESMLNFLIKIFKEGDQSVIGWHDFFFFYSFHSIELAHDYLDADDLIYIQHSFGGYCHNAKKYILAEAYYRRALDTLFEAAESDQPSARAMMCTPNLLFDLGSLMLELNRDKEAEEFYVTMLKGKDLLIELDPDYYMPLIADAYYDLALVYLNTNRLKKAKESAVEAYIIYKKLHKADSERWKESVESTSDLLDDIEARLGR